MWIVVVNGSAVAAAMVTVLRRKVYWFSLLEPIKKP